MSRLYRRQLKTAVHAKEICSSTLSIAKVEVPPRSLEGAERHPGLPCSGAPGLPCVSSGLQDWRGEQLVNC